VPGDVCHSGAAPSWMGHGEPLESVVALVRRLHDLTAGTPLAAGGEVVCHGDIAPRNIVLRERSAVCLLDWDLAAPGPRVNDLALMARRLLNLDPGGPPPAVQGPRVRALLDAYGWQDREGLSSGSSNTRQA
jgi:aminoglycoside phosphotransferase (APT) family kinase protein